jgi:putative sterol carrier protein
VNYFPTFGIEMLSINQPQDILGMGIRNILSYRLDDPAYQKLVMGWNKTIIIEFRHIYGVTVIFHDNTITIEYDEQKNFDLKIILDINTMVEIAQGKEGPITAFLKGKIQIKKLWNIGILLKFIKIFIPNIKKAGESANHYQNY